MHSLTLATTLTALLATSLALALPAPATTAFTTPDYYWNVTHFSAGCTANQCTYNFHVCAPLDGQYPGFTASCSGDDQTGFEACEILSSEFTSGPPTVSARLRPQPRPAHADGVARIFLNLAYTDVDTQYVSHFLFVCCWLLNCLVMGLVLTSVGIGARIAIPDITMLRTIILSRVGSALRLCRVRRRLCVSLRATVRRTTR